MSGTGYPGRALQSEFMSTLQKVFLYFTLALLVAAGAVAGAAWYWTEKPVTMAEERVDYIIEAGSTPRSVARALNKAGIGMHEDAFVLMARLTGQDVHIKAGAYEAVQGDTPRVLLERMASGDMLQTRITLIEGWTYQRIREALRNDANVRQTLDGVDDAELLSRLNATLDGQEAAFDLGSPVEAAEGLFHPDTYVFVPGTADFDILRRAYGAQIQILKEVWEARQPGLPLKTPYEALILASIVEKETGQSAERARVAGVFINRLRLKMPLQTDPTVIYGMGDTYQGRIRKVDLQTDTPWNTYTRGGLPPTPIASVGRASLEAALHPEEHKYLYFVARGDGTSEFSRNLTAHNRAVAKYILGRGK